MPRPFYPEANALFGEIVRAELPQAQVGVPHV
jgi:hypothetical protein